MTVATTNRPLALRDFPADETALVRSLVKESLYDFVQEFWDVVCDETPIWNWHIPYLCKELEIVARRAHKGLPKLYDLVINVPPGSTKSLLVSIMFPAWVWTWWPGFSYIGSSFTNPLAVRMSRLNRQIIKSDKYRACFPELRIVSDQDAKGYFVNDAKGERMCCSIDGDVVGRHADCIGVDDPLNPRGARSEAELLNANVFLKETLWSRKKSKAVTPTILIMQRLHQNDPSGMMLETFGTAVKHICLPAELSKDVKPKELAKNYVDGLLDPVRLDKKVLAEARRLGDFFFAGQLQQNPIPLGGGMFKTERIRIDEPPNTWTMKVRYWDKAGSTKKQAAYTVGVLMGKNCDGRFWILDVVRGRWDAGAREQKIKQVAELDGRQVIVGVEQEGGSGGLESAQATIRNLAGWRVQADTPTGDKALRADPFAAQVNNYNVSMVKAPWNADYLSEMSFFPESTYKDQVDASSGAFKLLTKPRIKVGTW